MRYQKTVQEKRDNVASKYWTILEAFEEKFQVSLNVSGIKSQKNGILIRYGDDEHPSKAMSWLGVESGVRNPFLLVQDFINIDELFMSDFYPEADIERLLQTVYPCVNSYLFDWINPVNADKLLGYTREFFLMLWVVNRESRGLIVDQEYVLSVKDYLIRHNEVIEKSKTVKWGTNDHFNQDLTGKTFAF